MSQRVTSSEQQERHHTFMGKVRTLDPNAMCQVHVKYQEFIKTRPDDLQLHGDCFHFMQCVLQIIDEANFDPSTKLLKQLKECAGARACEKINRSFEKKCFALFKALECAFDKFERFESDRSRSYWTCNLIFTRTCTKLIKWTVLAALPVLAYNYEQEYVPHILKKGADWQIVGRGKPLLKASTDFLEQLNQIGKTLILPLHESAKDNWCYQSGELKRCDSTLMTNLAAMLVAEKMLSYAPMIVVGDECYQPRSAQENAMDKIETLVKVNDISTLMETKELEPNSDEITSGINNLRTYLMQHEEGRFENIAKKTFNFTAIGMGNDAARDDRASHLSPTNLSDFRLLSAKTTHDMVIHMKEAIKTSNASELIREGRRYFAYINSISKHSLAVLTLEKLNTLQSIDCLLAKDAKLYEQGGDIDAEKYASDLTSARLLKNHNERLKTINKKSRLDMLRLNAFTFFKSSGVAQATDLLRYFALSYE